MSKKRSRSRKQRRDGQCRWDRRPSPQRRTLGKEREPSTTRLPTGTGANGSGVDQGEGKQVFAQLKKYLNEQGPSDYVLHLVLRLNGLARERGFMASRSTMGIGHLPQD
ncbi:hypothetical protein JG687_00001842 [Phytophthora cactorum]|uniref:Uncharacterized protein n=1 Tax=Phytophthora cactorum TaxID=29920 RepID=A0A8T1UX17_9STRA|nr:hypothetical protein JG687_00001842 [Phytophthora cactorum]